MQQLTDVGIILGVAAAFWVLAVADKALTRWVYRWRARRRFQRDLRAQKQSFQDLKTYVQDRLYTAPPNLMTEEDQKRAARVLSELTRAVAEADRMREN